MKVAGEATVRGSAESVWDALHDSAALAAAIPGCEQFDAEGPGQAQFIGIAALPAISGTYAVKLAVTDQQRPGLLRLTVAATGDQGTVAADVTLRLSEAGDATTLVGYEATGAVTGPLAGVGTRLLISAAKRLAAGFFAGIERWVTAGPAIEPVGEPVPAVPPAPVRLAAQTRVLARPAGSADRRTALVAGAAIGLAGIVVGVLAGRWSRRAAGRVRA